MFPDFAYGDYCENVNVTCTPDYCDNGGYCLNKPGYQECLCTEGYSDARFVPYEPRCEKTGLQGFRPGLTQTGLYSRRTWPEA